MGLLDFFKKLNRATGGKDPNTAIFAGMESLGLKVTSQDGAVTDLAGTFEGRESAMTVDASRIMKAGTQGYLDAARTALAGATGLISAEYQDWKEGMNDFYARERMQNAQIILRWAIFSPTPAPGTANIGRSKKIGEAVGGGFYAKGDAAVLDALRQPAVQAALETARCDELVVKGKQLQALWAPPMSEYQKVAASPDAFTQTCDDVLMALSRLADAVCGPVQ